MRDIILDLLDFVKFELLGVAQPPLPPFDFSMQFELHKSKDGLWITSKGHPGFIASGKDVHELREAVFETLLVYYDVPRYHSKKIKDLVTLTFPDGTVVNPPQPIFSLKVRMA